MDSETKHGVRRVSIPPVVSSFLANTSEQTRPGAWWCSFAPTVAMRAVARSKHW